MKFGTSLAINFKIKSILDFLETAALKKLSAVELVIEPPHCFIDGLTEQKRKEIKSKAEELGLELTIHATFADINLGSLNPNVRRFALKEIKKCIRLASELEAKIVTVHPGDLGAIGITFPEKTKNQITKSLVELTEFAIKMNVKIGLENMPICPWIQLEDIYTPEGIRSFVETVDSSTLGITWDIGHSNTTNIPLEEFFKAFAKYLIHVHLNDNEGIKNGWRDTHLEVGQGSINWGGVYEKLQEINYPGLLIFELRNWQMIDNSLAFIHNIRKD
ncbi:MAG: TIM barrel protein [Candidatus Heimdallarchaeota archaeon]|nr:TIM barrel protein [Candidatus Heimdallarchaeota archaeon]